MATIVVKDSNGRPVVNAQVTANTVIKYAWGDYNLAGKTDENGVCELTDRNERYRLSIEGIGVKTVDKLRNVIHLLSPGQIGLNPCGKEENIAILTVTDSHNNPIHGAFIRVIPYIEGDEQPYTIITNPEGKCGIDDRARTYIFVVTFGKKRGVTTQKNPRGEIRITI